MLVKINGKSEEVQGTTVLDLLKLKNIDPHMVAVELNSAMVERDSLGATAIRTATRSSFCSTWEAAADAGTQTDHELIGRTPLVA
jgi:sulfur carrier protein